MHRRFRFFRDANRREQAEGPLTISFAWTATTFERCTPASSVTTESARSASSDPSVAQTIVSNMLVTGAQWVM